MTAAQRGMWFAENLQRDYSVTVAHYLDITDVDRPLDRDLFRRAVREAARSLESAYTRIELVDDVPMVLVDPDIDFDVTEMDLRSDPDPLAAAQAWMTADHRRPMDLTRDPIAISRLIRVADDRALWYLRGHHIAFDGYSALNSLHEAVHRYNAMSRGEEYVHPPRASLAEVAADDAAYGDSTRRDGDRRHWVERVADLPERVTLARRATSARLSPANVVASTRLDPTTQGAIEASAAETSSSVATVLTAAFAAYLAAVTGTDDVVLSLPVTGRAAAKMKRASGMVSNMLPVRAGDLGTISGRALIRDVQTELTGVLRHQRYRYEDIRGHAGLTDASAASFGPIVNLVFFDRPIAIDGARTDYQILSSGILDDLRVNLYSAGPGERLVVDLHGNPNLYSHSELDEHLTRFLTYVERLLADLDRPVRTIELLLPGEHDAVLDLGRNNAVSHTDSPAADTHLLAPFLRGVARTPDAPALVTDDVVLTYRAVDDRRRELAAQLVDAGVVPGDRVVIALERGVEQVCAVYAVLGLGAVYVPVDPDEARDRRTAITAIVQPRVTIDGGWTPPRPPAEHARRVADRLVGVGPAYVIFTSGSTGVPKGVVVDHAAVLTRLWWMQSDHPVSATDVILHKTPTTFDVSIWELFWPLMTGATMVIARPGGHRDPRYLHEIISRHDVTTVHFVPAMLDVYLDAEQVLPASVRQVFTSGEALSVSAGRRLLAGSSATLVNLYGPTEAAVDVTAHTVDGHADIVPIGRPVAGTDVYVLDPALRVVPVGVVGELHIAGRQLALGYVGAPDRTAERFVADPYGAPGDRMYRTGDLVRWNDSGVLEYLGRDDHQVKIRGQRVELGEIESVLESVDGVDAATVIARTDLGPAPLLVAYVRGDAAAGDEHRVMASARRRLPAHMVPGAVVVVDEFPVTSSGKVDRRALPEPTVRTGVEHAQAESEVEIALAATIADLLGREQVGMRDNLFTLGADSLVAARLVSMMRSRHGLDLALTDVFDAATIGELAERALHVSEVDGADGVVAMARPAILPLSPAQTRLWFINRMAPHEPTYNMPGALRLPGDTDTDAVIAAVGDVVARHEILRTRFPSIDGEPAQEITAAPEAVTGVTADIGDVVTVAADRLDHAIGEIVGRGFDLTRELPVRARLLRVPTPGVVDHPGVAESTATTADENSSPATDVVVVVVVHHIAADGQSLPPLLADLMTAYTARRAHRAPDFAPLTLQYADATLRSRARLGDVDDPTPAARAELDFWRNELEGAPEILTLPTDRPRPQIPSGAGDHVDAVIPAALADGVRDLAGDLSVTPFAVVHSALAVVLGRLAGTDDVCIGTAVAGRDDPATAGLIGMFVNTVVLRSRIDPVVSVAEHIAVSHRTAARAIAHGAIPFERVVDAVARRRGSSHPPLVGVALTMQVDPLAALDRVGAIPLTDRSRVRAAKYDLTLTLTESADRIADAAYRLEITYATDLFDRETAVELGRQLQRVLQTMVDAPTRPVGRIDLVAPDRIAAAAAPPLVSASPQPLRHLLATGARVADPDAPAVSGEITMAWSVFEAWTNQMARELLARGVGPGDVVAIAIARSAHSVAALVAVAKTGAAFVTIDPANPPARRAQLVADSAAVLGLTVRDALGENTVEDSASSVPWVAIDDVAFELALAGYSGAPVRDEEIRRPVRIDDLAYLLYTSGSTGRPKAAAITHAGLTAMVDGQRSIMGANPGGRHLHVASPSFDVSVYEILMALCAGGELVIAPPDVFAGDELTALMVRHRVTHAVVTPLVAATLDPAALTEVTLMGFAGEKVPPELVAQFDAPHRSLFNMYGPSEATIWTTVARLRPDAPVTIGRPVPGFAALVLDDWLRPVAGGVIGELYLAGAGVGRGYHERPALTATRFVAHPFLPGVRMYRTGDLVSRHRDGALVYHGRNDFQIKLRGMRIEPGEVDGVLRRHPGVDRAVSVGATTTHGETVLVTYVTPSDGAVLVPEQIVDHARRHLPAHLVPHTVMVIDDLPRNRSGKVDRSALPPVELRSGHDFVAPRSELETIVAGVMESVVGVEQVGVHDDFFAIGGNSLSATKVVSRLERLLDRRLPLRILFENPSVATLVGALGSSAPGSGASAAGDDAPPLTTRRRSEVVPVSGAQRGMWLVNNADPTSGSHNISLSLHLAGALDVEALRAGVVDLVARHETLRTVYPLVGSEPAQVILPAELVASHFEVSIIDTDPAEEASAVAALCDRGFDLTAELPVRAAVVRRGTDDHELVFVVHHISADGVSLRPLGRDLVRAYLARRDAVPPSWPALPLHYADYVSWHRERLAACDADGVSRAQRQLDHWARRLHAAPGPVALPTDRPRPAVASDAAAAVDLTIPADLVTTLSAVARSTGTTLFMVVHAAYAVLLSRLSGRGDIVIGTPFSGRLDEALDDVVGMFVNTLALRTEIDPGERFTDLLDRVRADDLTDMAHADVAFDDVVARVSGPAVTGRATGSPNPLFSVMLAFQNLEFPVVEVEGLRIAPQVTDTVAAKVDLELILFPTDPTGRRSDGAMTGRMIYATDLFDDETVRRLVDRWTRLLADIGAHPDRVVGDLVFSDGPTAEPVAEVDALPDLVAVASSVDPDAVAVELDGTTVSFGEIDSMAAAMQITLPDGDAYTALTVALTTVVPVLGQGDVRILDEALDQLQSNARRVAGVADAPASPMHGHSSDGTGRE
ncbi:amino acid adenylation domain-containing protein [Williamsia sp. MIQD14]|uniref:amino acid adenylation domain-containing protein n=1 Tax=Williamsia sp. MIQD14 TaxID=3425703 RepID=UPI003D9FD3CC